jgi:amino acid transporter
VASSVAASAVVSARAAIPGGLALLAGFLASWRLAQESFAGSATVMYFGEESADPGRSMPRAIFGAALAVILIYLLIVAAVLHVLGRVGVGQAMLPLAADGTPAVALLLTAAVAMPLAFTNTFEQIFTLTAFLGLTLPLGTSASLLILRRRAPGLARPYRARGYPVLPLIGVIVPAAVMLGAVVLSPRNAAVGLALIALAYPAFRFAAHRAVPGELPS